jgi:TolB-like protein/Tfp pilus assembly protein PilF
MTQKGFKRKLTAILSADVAGYSRLMGEDEEATVRTLTAYREVIETLINDNKGRVVDSPGDNILAEFTSVVDSLRCAWEIQQEIKFRNSELSENRRMNFRIGINLGDVIEEGNQIYGDGVNIAARLEGLAKEGEICISCTAYDHVKNKLPVKFEYEGEQTVKNISEPVRVYRVRMKAEVDIPELSKELNLPDKPSIAVLPFLNMSGDPEQEYFSDGISDDIITDLSKLSGLFVIARNSSFIYKDKPVNLHQVGRKLGVRYVLEGSVRKGGNQVRITAQLIDAESGHHLWANRFDRKLEDIFAVQDEITEEVVTALDVKLVRGEQALLWRKSLKNHKARDLFYQGREIVNRVTKEATVEARELFERVIELEPDSPLGYSWSAVTHWLEAWRDWSKSPDESRKRAEELAQKALSLDDNNPDAHSLLGLVYVLDGQFEKAISEGERAISLGPSSAVVALRTAIINMFFGRPQEAIMLVKKAIRLNPIPSASYFNILGGSYRDSKQFEEAIATLKEAIVHSPEDVLSRYCLVTTYCAVGRYEEARAELQEILRIDPRFSLEHFTMRLPYKDQAINERVLSDLRKGGLL